MRVADRTRRVALALSVVLSCLGAAAPAQAAIRAGSVLDPKDQKPNSNASQADVAGLRVTSDDARGAIRIALTMHDAWTGSVEDPTTLAGPEGTLKISLGRRVASGCSAGARTGDLVVEAIFSADQAAGTATLVGKPGEIEAREEQTSRGAREVTYLIADPALVGLGYDCAAGIVAEAGFDRARDEVAGFTLAAVSQAPPAEAPQAPEPQVSGQAASAVPAAQSMVPSALGGAQAGPAAPARLASLVSIRSSQSVSLSTLLRGGLRLPVACSSACRARGTLEIESRRARRLRVPTMLALGSATLGEESALGVKMRARRGAARWPRALLVGRARITVAVTPLAGGEAAITARRVRLVR